MTKVSLSGSCLCGAITYTVDGDAKNFWHCYCERCRKATGTGHASNIIMSPAELRWTAGSVQLREFKVPEARFFTNVFCSVCGGRMPRYSAERELAVIPAGSLDTDPGIEPNGRIFSASKTRWSCDMRELASFDQYPPKP